MEELDYQEKILNFLAMTETKDQIAASKYLEEANWDESLAVNNFYNKIDNSVNDMNNNNNIINDITKSSSTDRNLIDINKKNIKYDKDNSTNNRKQNIFKKIFIFSLNFLRKCCSEKREVKKSEEQEIFKYLPNFTNDFFYFGEKIKQKCGIIILYTKNNIDFLNQIISQISRRTIISNILKKNFLFLPLLANTNEGYRLQNIISDKQLQFPSFIFCNNSMSNRDNMSILSKKDIIYILDNESITLNSFHKVLMDISKRLNLDNDVESDIKEFDTSFDPLTDAEILAKQKNDMEELERQVQKKEKEKKIQEKKNEEEKKKLEDIEEKAKQAKIKILDEPNDDNPDCCTICFRYPDGEKTIQRKFLKNNIIQNLYDYVTSLGEEIYTEKENYNFSLCQVFPPKKFDVMENTLEKEGLFPNAVIQIKEE